MGTKTTCGAGFGKLKSKSYVVHKQHIFESRIFLRMRCIIQHRNIIKRNHGAHWMARPYSVKHCRFPEMIYIYNYILCLIIISKSEVWTITHCLELGHETMVCAVCLSIPCDDWDNIYIYILSYYHHQILFRVRSWNTGVRCMSFYILITLLSWLKC